VTDARACEPCALRLNKALYNTVQLKVSEFSGRSLIFGYDRQVLKATGMEGDVSRWRSGL